MDQDQELAAATRPGDGAPAASEGRTGAWGLPPGWSAIGRCRQGLSGPSGCLVLVHPERGVALLDLAPAITPNAEARFRRLLATATSDPDWAARLPVRHLRLEAAEWWRLPPLLRSSVTMRPDQPRDGRRDWIAAVRDALARDPAWRAAGPRGMDPDPFPEDSAPEVSPKPLLAAAPAPRRGGGIRPWALGLGFAAVFLAGLAAGLWMGVTPGDPAHHPASAEAVLPDLAPGPIQGAAAPPLDQAAAGPEDTAAEAQQPVAAEPDPPAVAPDPPAEVAPMPLPAPSAPAPPRRAASPPRPPPTLDRRCAEAVFRWQRGEVLTWSEMAHVRQGCAGSSR